MPARLYFDADDGTAYRVYDVTFTSRRTTRVPLGAPVAHYRIFVPRTGARRSYKFGPRDSHAITEDELTRQLRESQFLASKPFVTSTLTPTSRPPYESR